MFIEEFKKAFAVMKSPGAETKDNKDIGGILGFYYKVSVIPAIITIIIYIAAIVFFSGGIGIISLVAVLASIWIAVPIGILIGAAWLHLFGKFLLKTFKGTYSNTVTGIVYTYMPQTTLLWLTSLLTVASAAAITAVTTNTNLTELAIFGALASIVGIVFAIWSFIIGLFALANQNSTTKLRVFLTELVASLVIVIPVVLIAFFVLGVFNAAVLGGGSQGLLSNACIASAGYLCSSPMLYSNMISLQFAQNTGQNWDSATIYFTPTGSVGTCGGSASEVISGIRSGETVPVQIPYPASPNSDVAGTLWVQYSTSGSAGNCVEVASMILKAS